MTPEGYDHTTSKEKERKRPGYSFCCVCFGVFWCLFSCYWNLICFLFLVKWFRTLFPEAGATAVACVCGVDGHRYYNLMLAGIVSSNLLSRHKMQSLLSRIVKGCSALTFCFSAPVHEKHCPRNPSGFLCL